MDRRTWLGEASHHVEQRVTQAGRGFDMLFSRRQVDAPGGRRLLLGVALDVTAQREQERRLERQRCFTDQVVDRIDQGIVVKDAQQRYLVVNEGYLRLTGRTRAELIGRSPAEVFGSAERAGVVAQVAAADARVLAERVAVQEEHQIDFGAGARHYWSDRRPITLPDGSDGVLMVVRDVNAEREHEATLRAAMERAQAAVEARSRFVAHMSHEIRTPINGIMGMTDLVLGSAVSPSQREWLTLARQSADNLLAIVNDVLDLAKIDAGATRVECAAFDLHGLVAAVARPMALRARAKGLRFACSIATEVPRRFEGDAARLRQVLTNLLGNAVKFTDSGQVSLRVVAEAEQLAFHVGDSGPGIAADQQARIFEPFAQADESPTRRHGGTGLGLPISRQLALLMGGRLGLQSEPGRGSDFHLHLPLPTAAQAPRPQPLHGQVIAWAGDAGGDDGNAPAWLAHWGARVVGRESVQQPVDAIVLDRTGDAAPWADAIRAWREQGQLRRLVVIDASGELAVPVVASGGLAAARGLPLQRLSSPFAPGELLASLTRSASADAPTATDSESKDPPLAGLQVLLAEDNPVNRLLAETVLRQLGAEVTTADDGVLAFEALGRQRFELALMDIQMPGLDGSDVVQRWRHLESAQAAPAGLPIIAMTAHAMVGDRERFRAQGFDGYVGKPFTRAALLAEIARVCPSASRCINLDACEQT